MGGGTEESRRFGAGRPGKRLDFERRPDGTYGLDDGEPQDGNPDYSGSIFRDQRLREFALRVDTIADDPTMQSELAQRRGVVSALLRPVWETFIGEARVPTGLTISSFPALAMFAHKFGRHFALANSDIKAAWEVAKRALEDTAASGSMKTTAVLFLWFVLVKLIAKKQQGDL